MAITRGCYGTVEVDAATVAEVKAWELNTSAEVLDSSAIGDCTKSYTVGAVDWSGTVSCWWDATDTNGQEAMDVGTTITTLSLQPEGDTTADVTYSGSAIITSIARSGAVDSIVEANFSFQGTGTLTQGVVPA